MQEARLRAIGLPLDDIPRFPLPIDLPPRERGLRGITLMKSGYLGPKHNYNGPGRGLDRDPLRPAAPLGRPARGQAPARRCSGSSPTTSRGTWSSTTARRASQRGAAASPTLTLRSSFEDFVDIGAGRADPARLMLRRRLRPKGDLRLLLRLPKLFG